ncbi:uncharacterized protein K02A2.6-like [Pararge aegeria]|uniref:uncharacterized protein K02A2.6-like n=1 Tax=Pararge aegeria TaxID=116150 RepID=UPI0019D2BED2|nr:uncharacterized protein K02A2.6-like [Pararge aegeria]
MEHARPPPELSVDGSPVSRADAWKKWKTQFQLFIKAAGVHKEDPAVQASLLINLIGSDGFDVYQTFTFEKETDRDDVAVLLKKFDSYFGVKPNITLARYNFFTRNQVEGESINQYVTALKLLTKTCVFSLLEEELIRDRIVCGIRNTVVRDRLLRTDELTLEKAIKICQADEVSMDGTRQLETRAGSSSGASIDAVEARGRDRASGSRRWNAYSSGSRAARGAPAHRRGGHAAGRVETRAAAACKHCGQFCESRFQCFAAGVKCYLCGGQNHFARMCSDRAKKVYDIDVYAENDGVNSDSDSGESFFISMIANTSQRRYAEDWFETLTGEYGVERFKLDTGADINVISFERFLLLGYNISVINRKTNVKLQSYSGNIIPIKGICDLNWWYKHKLYKLKFAVASISCQSVLGRQACTELGLVKRVHDINLSYYDNLFRGIGCLPGTYSIVIDKSVSPVVSAPRKIPLSLRDKLQVELKRMVDCGVIRKVTHPTQWVNSLVIAAKKNGGIRLCLDPRPLNCAIQRAHFQLPTINEIATKLTGAQYFSVLDANSGFWAIKLDSKSADLCTFSTPFGRYQFLRLPFGLNCASEVFHSTLKQLLEDLVGVDLFIDDIICWGRNKNEHDQRLTALLNRAQEINLKFNKDKCKICVTEVVYLGHVFNKNGMKPDADKVKAIKNMPIPNDKKSLERFLGATNYLSKFIPNYSNYTVQLTQLLKKESTWYWDNIHDRAISKLKELVSSAPVLALYDVTRPVVLSVDASSVALGAVLMQDGRPVEYASRTLTDTQTRYAQIEKELLAIVYACEKYHQYIFGKKICNCRNGS